MKLNSQYEGLIPGQVGCVSQDWTGDLLRRIIQPEDTLGIHAAWKQNRNSF